MTAPIQRLSVSDIARLARVERSTVSNWQRRHNDFPKPLPDASGRPQFDGAAVREWLARRYPDMAAAGTNPVDDLVILWLSLTMEDFIEDGLSSDGLALLIAAADGRRVCFDEVDPEGDLPFAITAEGLEATFLATDDVSAGIQSFLRDQLDGLSEADRADLIDAAAAEVDAQARWRRTDDAEAAERNLHDSLAQLIGLNQRVLDLACGSGALLASVGREDNPLMLTGMEPDYVQASIAQARLGQRFPATVISEDPLVTGVSEQSYDVVVSIPPFGRSVDDADPDVLRHLPFGPVRGNADAAWPQLAFQALAPEGEALLVLPHTLAVEERSDQIRREMIRQGVLAAVVTLPPNAHPSSRMLTDLWVISRRYGRGEDVLFGDMSNLDPAHDGSYAAAFKVVGQWLDDRSDIDDPRFVRVNPIELLDQTVKLDPQYWCARAKTPTESDDLIAKVEQTALIVRRALQGAAANGFPSTPLVPATTSSITVRDACNDGLLTVVPRPPRSSGDSRRLSANRAALEGIISIPAAETMRREQYEPHVEPAATGRVSESISDATLRAGDVLVWATSDHEVRAVVCPRTGGTTINAITALRCGPGLDPTYLALVLSAGRNAIHTTGSTTPVVRAMDLLLPLVPLEKQQQIAKYTNTAGQLSSLAQSISTMAGIYVEQLADALGSGAVTIDETADD